MRTLNPAFVTILGLLLPALSVGQSDYNSTSVGAALRPNAAHYVQPPKYLRVSYSTSFTDSSHLYSQIGLDWSFKPVTSMLALEVGINTSRMEQLNFRPHLGISGIPIIGNRFYDGLPFGYGGFSLESNHLHPVFLGVSIEWLGLHSPVDLLMYLRCAL